MDDLNEIDARECEEYWQQRRTAEQWMALILEAERLHSFVSRDLQGYAPAGTDMAKLRRVVDAAWARVERRQAGLEGRLISVR